MAALGPNLNPINNPPNPNGIQPPAPQNVNVVDAKLAEASARKLAKNILSGKMTTSGEFKTTSLGSHKANVLSGQINDRRKELSKQQGISGKLAHTFQRVKNFLTAGGRIRTDMQLLDEAEADLGTKIGKAESNAPQLKSGGVLLARGNIAENQFPGKKTVVVNSANTKLEWGRGGTNRALSDVVPKDKWENVHGHTSHRPFARSPDRIVVGEAVSGPQISDDFSMIQALGPRLDANTRQEDLPALQAQVLEAYENALKLAKEQGAECVQVPQFCTGSFMRDAPDDVKKAWPDMVNTAFLLAVQSQNRDGAMQVAMVIPEGATEPDFARASLGTAALREQVQRSQMKLIADMVRLAETHDMVAFYKDGPTACFGNFSTVPGGFEVQTAFLGKKRFYNVEAALHYAKAENAIILGRGNVDKLANDPLFKELQLCKTGEEALRLGRALERKYPQLYSNGAHGWHNGTKQKAVFEALQAKFALEPFHSLLQATGDTYLLEHKASPKAQDNYWSDGGDGKGVNALGYMLMAIRSGVTEVETLDLQIDPNHPDYVADKAVSKHAETANAGLDYTIYGQDRPREPSNAVRQEGAGPDHFEQDLERSLLSRAEQGDPEAKFELGLRYRLEHPEVAVRYFQELESNPEFAGRVREQMRDLELFDEMPSDDEYDALPEPAEDVHPGRAIASALFDQAQAADLNKNWVKFQENYARLQPDNTPLDQLKEGLVHLERMRREERSEADRVKVDEMDGMIAALKSRIEVTEQNLPPLEVRREQAQAVFKEFRSVNAGFNRLRGSEELQTALAKMKELRAQCNGELNPLSELQEMDNVLNMAEATVKRLTTYNDLKALIEGKLFKIDNSNKNAVEKNDAKRELIATQDFQRLKEIELAYMRFPPALRLNFAYKLVEEMRRSFNG